MKIKTRIILTLTIISSFCIKAEGLNTIDNFGLLPSEQTYQEIQSMLDSPELRARPDGGGPSIGEVINPVPDMGYTGFLIIAASYIVLIIRRNKESIYRNIP